MIDGAKLVKKLNLEPTGQLELFPDPEYTVRNSVFTPTGNASLDRQWLIYFWMYAYIPDGRGRENVDYEKYYLPYSDAIHNYFKYVKPGMCHEIRTKQKRISIAMKKNKGIDRCLKELLLWLPHIKHVEEDVEDIIPVRSIEVLSMNYCYDLYIEGETGAPAGKTYLCSRYDCEFSGELKDVLTHIKRNFYLCS